MPCVKKQAKKKPRRNCGLHAGWAGNVTRCRACKADYMIDYRKRAAKDKPTISKRRGRKPSEIDYSTWSDERARRELKRFLALRQLANLRVGQLEAVLFNRGTGS